VLDALWWSGLAFSIFFWSPLLFPCKTCPQGTDCGHAYYYGNASASHNSSDYNERRLQDDRSGGISANLNNGGYGATGGYADNSNGNNGNTGGSGAYAATGGYGDNNGNTGGGGSDGGDGDYTAPAPKPESVTTKPMWVFGGPEVPTRRRLAGGGNNLVFIQHSCGVDEYNELATLLLSPQVCLFTIYMYVYIMYIYIYIYIYI